MLAKTSTSFRFWLRTETTTFAAGVPGCGEGRGLWAHPSVTASTTPATHAREWAEIERNTVRRIISSSTKWMLLQARWSRADLPGQTSRRAGRHFSLAG